MQSRNNEEHLYYRRIYDCFEDSYTSDAKGINIDYMIALSYSENKKNIFIRRITIENLFEATFNQVKDFYKNTNFNNEPLKIINYILDQDIVKESELLSTKNKEKFFNYCVKLSDRNQPEIAVSIPSMVSDLKEKLEKLVGDRKSNKIYDRCNEEKLSSSEELRKELIENINKDLCIYIILWIHAYRFKTTLAKVNKNKDDVLFSHRFKGWSQPIYELTEDLKLEFATNFGYGKSSYFRLILVYKGVALINFIEWIDYRIKGASAVKSHTRKYEGSISAAGVSNRFINNDNWIEAAEETKEICEIYLKDEDEFINEFIFKSLDNMVNELEDIFEIKIVDNSFNRKHKLFDNTLESLRVKNTDLGQVTSSVVVMSAKGEKITGALEFMSNIMQLKDFFSVDTHVTRIKTLNKKILPLMENELKSIPQERERLFNELNKLSEDLDRVNQQLDRFSNLDLNNEGNQSHEEQRALEEHELILESISKVDNDLSILRKCEKEIKGYKRVIERLEV